MKYLSQNNKRWKNKKLGFCNRTIGNYGCAITCIDMIGDSIRVDDFNAKIKKHNGYTNGCEVKWNIACSLLGLKYEGEAFKPKRYPCIGRMIWNRQLHFVVFVGGKTIIDPWDGKKKKNPYKRITFINIKETLALALKRYKIRYTRKYGRKPSNANIFVFKTFLRVRGYR